MRRLLLTRREGCYCRIVGGARGGAHFRNWRK